MNKRDLKADLKSIQEGRTLFDDPDPSVGTKYELYEVAEHAIERALKAEALVRKYEEIGCTPEEVIDVVRRFTSFLCEMTGGRMSKPNYILEDMIAVADDYHQKICDESLQENVKHATEMEALARELVDMLGRVTPCYLTGRLELDLDLVHEANGLLKKAKEVLGDE